MVSKPSCLSLLSGPLCGPMTDKLIETIHFIELVPLCSSLYTSHLLPIISDNDNQTSCFGCNLIIISKKGLTFLKASVLHLNLKDKLSAAHTPL
jgi:hypothetical protein